MNSQSVQTPDGIKWHVESIESANAKSTPDADKEHIILIPSGEGDCHNLSPAAIALAQAGPFPVVVTTFDMPGFSRSIAPLEAYEIVTPTLVARQIITLLDTLQISRATFFGSSSGGGAVIAIIALYSERVKCGIVHEVPFATPPTFVTIRAGTDDEIIQAVSKRFDSMTEEQNDGKQKEQALGQEYFKRREKNFVTWMRCLVTNYETQTRPLATKENLRKRPLFWTIGGLSNRDYWTDDLEVAESAGLKVETDVLMCMHFPYVTVPEQMAKWILQCIENVNSSEA